MAVEGAKKRGRPKKTPVIEAPNIVEAGKELVKKRPHESSPVIGDNMFLVEGGLKCG